ncbi:MAG: NAD(P)H-binding protein [Chitinophagales bacterium]
MRVVLLGATGLVGGHLLQQLLALPACTAITAVTRRPLQQQHPKLSNLVINFDQMEQHAAKFSGDVLFSALGTTIAKAGSQEVFQKIDATYQITAAKLARAQGVTTHGLVSALGADASSSIFYNRVKGATEQAIIDMQFPNQLIVRPSIILGERQESRPGEAVGQWVASNLSFLFSGPLKKYRGVPAEIIAAALIAAVQNQYKGLHIVENDQLWAVAKG